jgi:hypothetical protein
VLDPFFQIGTLVGGRFPALRIVRRLLWALRLVRGDRLSGKDKRQQKHGNQVEAHRMHCKVVEAAKLRYFFPVASAN